MQKTTPSIESIDTAHLHRLQSMVKRLIIERGYLESRDSLFDTDVKLLRAEISLNSAIDVLNEAIAIEAQKIAPTDQASAAKEIYPAVYPLPADEN